MADVSEKITRLGFEILEMVLSEELDHWKLVRKYFPIFLKG